MNKKDTRAVSAARIASLRSEFNLTQHQLGQLVQDRLHREKPFSPAVVSTWEIGRRMPSAAVIDVLAEIFHTTPDYIRGETDTKEENIPKETIRTIQIAYTSLKHYEGKPVYIVFPLKNHSDCWGLVHIQASGKPTILTLDGLLVPDRNAVFEVYVREFDYIEIRNYKALNRLGISQILNTAKPVWVSMITTDLEVRAEYNGWYTPQAITDSDGNKKYFLEDSVGHILPVTGLGKSYWCYTEKCF